MEDVHLTVPNQTGKLLSPRKILMDTRDRITEISRNKRKGVNDEKSLLGDYISPEELAVCTSCNGLLIHVQLN